jgi:hypothetical protein
VKHLAPACFRAFACAQGSCPDSCCRAGWEIVPDEETLKLYQTLPGEAGERIRAGIVSAVLAADPGGHTPCEEALRAMAAEVRGHYGNAEPLLQQDGERVCVLLDADGLCCVQKHFGHGALCRVCREYPRFHREFGGLTEHGISLSCPTAYALATAAPPAWEEWEDGAPPVPNDLDPEAYLRLRKGRTLALDLLTREALPLWQRLTLVRKLAAALQGAPERIVRHDYSIRLRRWSFRRDKHCLSAFAKQTIANRQSCVVPERFASGKLHSYRMPDKQCLSLHTFSDGIPDCCRRGRAVKNRPYGADGTLAALAHRFLALEILSPAWRDGLDRFAALAETGELPEDVLDLFGTRTAECRPCMAKAEPEAYARWLWYELYKYWLDALDDGKLLARVDRSLDMLLLGVAMDSALPGEGPFLRRISREIEHCEENLAALLR